MTVTLKITYWGIPIIFSVTGQIKCERHEVNEDMFEALFIKARDINQDKMKHSKYT